jgi:uncharacterized protein (TIGR03067 family)
MLKERLAREAPMILPIATLLAAGLVLTAAPTRNDVNEEIERFQGSWRVVSGMYGGEAGADAGAYTVVFEKDSFVVRRGDEVILKGRFRPDPSRTPKAIDMVVTDEDGEEEVHGIYALGEGLKWCTSGPGDKSRPAEFAAERGSGNLLLTLKKER